MALVATLSTAALRQQARAYDLEASERARVQANWILQGTTDWARLILREDARSGAVDHLGEPWAITLQEAKLSTFLANGAVGDEPLASDALQNAYLSGSITDLQSRLNVTNLVLDQQTHGPTLRAFGRLFERATDSPSGIATTGNKFAGWTGAPEGTCRGSQHHPQLQYCRDAPGQRHSPHSAKPGSDAMAGAVCTLRRRRPYVVVLPDRTTVDIDTAPSLVLQADYAGTGCRQCPATD